jgi:hypothetical protein
MLFFRKEILFELYLICNIFVIITATIVNEKNKMSIELVDHEMIVYQNDSQTSGNSSAEAGTLYQAPWYIITILSILYGILSILAVSGNGLIMWVVIRNKRMHNVTNYFISNLAMADIVIGLFATPFQV